MKNGQPFVRVRFVHARIRGMYSFEHRKWLWAVMLWDERAHVIVTGSYSWDHARDIVLTALQRHGLLPDVVYMPDHVSLAYMDERLGLSQHRNVHFPGFPQKTVKRPWSI